MKYAVLTLVVDKLVRKHDFWVDWASKIVNIWILERTHKEKQAGNKSIERDTFVNGELKKIKELPSLLQQYNISL